MDRAPILNAAPTLSFILDSKEVDQHVIGNGFGTAMEIRSSCMLVEASKERPLLD